MFEIKLFLITVALRVVCSTQPSTLCEAAK